ncbi:MAG: hypothetical protein KAX37_10805 [Opitutaceae bacterium]|nr:hypothetical protein [Opitutaceae bacterium]
MSYSCPHFDIARDYCLRLKTDCVPGRPGCVLSGSQFAVPAKERVQQTKEEKKERKVLEALNQDNSQTDS